LTSIDVLKEENPVISCF